MKDNQKKPLRIAISGMNGRAYKMMVMFFQGPCKGSAIVVTDDEAEAEILDADSINAKTLLAEKLSAYPERPIIVLSLQEFALENIIFVKKPVQTANMLSALVQARKEIKHRTQLKCDIQTFAEEAKPNQKLIQKEKSKLDVLQKKSLEKKQNKEIHDKEEQKKTTKHRTAMQLDEKGFSSLIGTAMGIDFNDSEQLLLASYNAADYYLGYVHSTKIYS